MTSVEMGNGTIVLHGTKRKLEEEEAEITAVRHTKKGVSINSILNPSGIQEPCQVCQEWISKWMELEARKVTKSTIFANRVAKRTVEQALKCAICSMIKLLQLDGFRDQKFSSYALLFLPNSTFDPGFRMSRKQRIHDCTYLGVIPAEGISKESMDHFIRSGCIATVGESPSSTSTAPGTRYIGSAVDWPRLKSWVNICLNTHGSHSKSRPTAADRTMFFLKVIDCASMPPVVVDAPEACKYVALSYVWGKSKHNSSGDNTTKKNPLASGHDLPQTILDAMETVRRLGFRYLWVDQYCIQQDGAHDKHIQIRNMDMIYAKAFLTIVAAAGDSSDYGLPGVGPQLRQLEQTSLIKDKHFTVVRPDPRAATQCSTWMTRGWTYQEVVLSTQRLVFTDNQVSFECDSMRCCESVENLPEKFQSRMMAGKYTGYSTFKAIGQADYDICDHIEEYTKRGLTYESDILNGLLGIFSAYEQLKNGSNHFWGAPFVVTKQGGKDSPAKRLLIGLFWHHAGESQRRQGFPSWSWAGWTGSVVFSRLKIDFLKTRIHVEIKAGDLVDIDQFDGLEKGFTSYHTLLQPVLHIEAECWKTTLQYLESHTLRNVPNCVWYFYLQSTGEPILTDIVYIRSPSAGSRFEHLLKNKREITCLLVRQNIILLDEQLDVTERVGMASRTYMFNSQIVKMKETEDFEPVSPEMFQRRRIRLS